MKNGQAEQNQGFNLDFVCPTAYKVRRAARFVRSIKYKILNIFCFLKIIKGFCRYHTCLNPLVYLVLCGLRFFYIPFCYLRSGNFSYIASISSLDASGVSFKGNSIPSSLYFSIQSFLKGRISTEVTQE